jgi:hypothetical protein
LDGAVACCSQLMGQQTECASSSLFAPNTTGLLQKKGRMRRIAAHPARCHDK